LVWDCDDGFSVDTFFGFAAEFLGEGCELAGGAVEVFFFAFFGAEDFFWAAGEVVGVVATHFGERCGVVRVVESKSRRTLRIRKLLGAEIEILGLWL
jgi:hypothetical protein